MGGNVSRSDRATIPSAVAEPLNSNMLPSRAYVGRDRGATLPQAFNQPGRSDMPAQTRQAGASIAPRGRNELLGASNDDWLDTCRTAYFLGAELGTTRGANPFETAEQKEQRFQAIVDCVIKDAKKALGKDPRLTDQCLDAVVKCLRLLVQFPEATPTEIKETARRAFKRGVPEGAHVQVAFEYACNLIPKSFNPENWAEYATGLPISQPVSREHAADLGRVIANRARTAYSVEPMFCSQVEEARRVLLFCLNDPQLSTLPPLIMEGLLDSFGRRGFPSNDQLQQIAGAAALTYQATRNVG